MAKRTAEELSIPPAKRTPPYEVLLERRIRDLEEENANMKYSFAAIEAKAKEFEDKYCNLVHLARGGNEKCHEKMKELHSAEYAMLTSDDQTDSDWQHGFNSGALATSRLLRCLADHFPEQHRRQEDELDEHEEEQEALMTGPELLQREYDFHLDHWPMLDS
jgi:hypothetical protein